MLGTQKSGKIKIIFKLIAENNFKIYKSGEHFHEQQEGTVQLETMNQNLTYFINIDDIEWLPDIIKVRIESAEENEDIIIFQSIFRDVTVNDDIVNKSFSLVKKAFDNEPLEDFAKSLINSEDCYLGILTFMSLLGYEEIIDKFSVFLEDSLTPKISFYSLLIALHHNRKDLICYYLCAVQLYLLNQRGILNSLEKTFLEKVDQNIISSRFKIVDQTTLALEIEGGMKIYFPVDILETANNIKSKIFENEIYWAPSNGFRCAEVKYSKFNYGMIDETNYSRLFAFHLDYQERPKYIAFQYAKAGGFYIYQNLGQPRDHLEVPFGRGYLGSIEANFLNIKFALHNSEGGSSAASQMPERFFSACKKIIQFNYDTEFFKERPSHFRMELLRSDGGKEMEFECLKPVWNEVKSCYELNFFGQASLSSSKNFILLDKKEAHKGKKAEFYLVQGKKQTGCFNLHFRDPLSPFQAFCTSLVAFVKKALA